MRCSGRFQKDFTPDHIFTLNACAEKYTLRNGKFYVAYVDFSKAFDTVQRPILWNILLRDGEKRKNDQDPEKACTVLLKGLVHADLAKKTCFCFVLFCMNSYCFMCDYYVALISALVLLKCGNLRIIVWFKNRLGIFPRCSYLRNAYYVITFCCFTHVVSGM